MFVCFSIIRDSPAEQNYPVCDELESEMFIDPVHAAIQKQ